MSSPDNGGSVSSSSGGQSNTASSGAIVVGDKSNPIIKQNAFPIDLAPKIALVKPTDGKGGTVQAHQFRYDGVFAGFVNRNNCNLTCSVLYYFFRSFTLFHRYFQFDMCLACGRLTER